MAFTNHKLNRFFIGQLGGPEEVKKIKSIYPSWRISSGGLDLTIQRDENKAVHGKEPVAVTAAKNGCCKNTVYNHQNKKEKRDVPQNALCNPCRVTGVFIC